MTKENFCKLLEDIASRGFLSEPQQHWLNKNETEQYCTFTEQEKKEIRIFLSENIHLARIGKHPIEMVGERPRSTVSLMGRITYATDSQHISPEYVAGLAAEVYESFTRYKENWEIAELLQKLTK